MKDNLINNAIKWAVKLGFSEEWLAKISDFAPAAEFVPFDPKNKTLFEKKDMMLNLVCYLNYCDLAEKFYQEKGISENILIDTLLDIKIWAYRYKEIFGGYGVKEINWLHNNIECNIFRVGRLQYKFGKSMLFSWKYRMKIAERILEIHIPRGEKLQFSECIESFKQAKVFFATFFPEYKYRHITCGSWMLDNKVLPKILSADSNIISFQNAFNVLITVPSRDCIRFVFGEHKNKKNLDDFEPKTSFQAKLKEHICSGKYNYVGYGILKEEFKK